MVGEIEVAEFAAFGEKKDIEGIWRLMVPAHEFGDDAEDPKVMGRRVGIEDCGIVGRPSEGGLEGMDGADHFTSPLTLIVDEQQQNLRHDIHSDDTAKSRSHHGFR